MRVAFGRLWAKDMICVFFRAATLVLLAFLLGKDYNEISK